MDLIEQFLKSKHVRRRKPTPAASKRLKAFSSNTGIDPPEEFLELYRRSNGLRIDKLSLEFLPIEEVTNYTIALANNYLPTVGFVPFTECDDSNPYAVACSAPMAFRIVHVLHDDDPRVAFSDLGGFLTALLELADEDEPFLDDLTFAYEDPQDRTKEDVADAKTLLKMANDLDRDDDRRGWLMHYAGSLLAGDCDEEWAILLGGPANVRSDTVRRLQAINTPATKERLAKYLSARNEFKQKALKSLGDAGVTVKAEKEMLLNVGSKNAKWIDLDFFYDYCDQPDVLERIVTLAKRK